LISRSPALTLSGLLCLAALLAGCAQLPPTPQDVQAKKFEPVPDKAVIYLVRDYPDFSDAAATIYLGDAAITTYAGTYYRWEVAPGTQRISGFGGDMGAITLQVEAGRIYYVLQRVSAFFRMGQSHYQLLGEPHGRAAVMRSVLLGG
jgi:hypothetical protein